MVKGNTESKSEKGKKEHREHERRVCSESTFYASEKGIYEGMIENIGIKGVYIKSEGVMKVGDIITVAVPSKRNKKGVKLKGEIVWKNRNGFGVDFKRHLND